MAADYDAVKTSDGLIVPRTPEEAADALAEEAQLLNLGYETVMREGM